jgi:hypothetical protein
MDVFGLFEEIKNTSIDSPVHRLCQACSMLEQTQ